MQDGMSELPAGMAPARVPEPRRSASAIVLRRGADREWEVLLGLRSRRSRFMHDILEPDQAQ